MALRLRPAASLLYSTYRVYFYPLYYTWLSDAMVGILRDDVESGAVRRLYIALGTPSRPKGRNTRAVRGGRPAKAPPNALEVARDPPRSFEIA